MRRRRRAVIYEVALHHSQRALEAMELLTESLKHLGESAEAEAFAWRVRDWGVQQGAQIDQDSAALREVQP